MSLFYPVTLPCPSCKEPVEFQACGSVNADRRPDLRETIINGQFRRGTCGKCTTTFRLDPQLIYLDATRNQWIVAYPASRVGDWEQLEAETREAFAKSYGERPRPTPRRSAANCGAAWSLAGLPYARNSFWPNKISTTSTSSC